jgi:V/A-type H+-transporting ATPase subunit D
VAKIKLTSQELRRQQKELALFERFLPTLTLKKLHLRIELATRKKDLGEKKRREQERREAMEPWIAVMGEDGGLEGLLQMRGVEREIGNIAGVNVPVLKGVRFDEKDYDLYRTPLWVDRAVEELKVLLRLRAEIQTLRRQVELLTEELRVTIQRVNLFERVKIPEARENIRAIRVFLGDQQTAAVVRGKIAKAKVSKRAAAEAGGGETL